MAQIEVKTPDEPGHYRRLAERSAIRGHGPVTPGAERKAAACPEPPELPELPVRLAAWASRNRGPHDGCWSQLVGQEVSVNRTPARHDYRRLPGIVADRERRSPGHSQANPGDRECPCAHTDHHALKQRPSTFVRSWPGLDGAGQPRLDAGRHLPVNLCDKCSHDRVAVLRPELGVHFSRGADVLRGHRRRTHAGRITP